MIERKLTDSLLMDIRDIARRIEKRLESLAGSGGPTGSAAAKRAGESGGPEDRERSDRPQSLAVPPGHAKLRLVFDYLHDVLRGERKHYGNPLFAWWPPYRRDARIVRETIARVENELRWVEWAAAQPVSEQGENAGDGLATIEAIEAGADSNCGTASGRRNDKTLATGGVATRSDKAGKLSDHE